MRELEPFINNPGLHHVAERIFSYIDLQGLVKLMKEHKSWIDFLASSTSLRQSIRIEIRRNGLEVLDITADLWRERAPISRRIAQIVHAIIDEELVTNFITEIHESQPL